VFADALEVIVIPNDMFMAIALPDGRAWRTTGGVHFPGGDGFAILYDRVQRPWLGTVWTLS
jgi:hypothetical protein